MRIMRRPPHPELIGFLGAYDRHISDLALALREIVLEEAPDAAESIYQVYTVAIWFGFSEKTKDMFCYLATNAKHVNLGFPKGASLADPNGVLEGDGKTMRHIKLSSLDEVERPFVRRYIHAAMEQTAPLGARGPGTSVVKTSVVKTNVAAKNRVPPKKTRVNRSARRQGNRTGRPNPRS